MTDAHDQFREKLKNHFKGKPFVAIWENDVGLDYRNDPVIRVGLNASVSLKEMEDMPAEVDGVKIVYYHAGDIRLMALNQRAMHDPMISGISFGAVDVSAGTLGGVVYDKETNLKYLLTNEHVVSASNNLDPEWPPKYHYMIQPGSYDGGNAVDHHAGNLKKVGGMKQAVLEGQTCDIDAALVIPSRDIIDDELWGIGKIEKYKHVEVVEDDEIIKSGRTSGVTTAFVCSVDVSANIHNIWGGAAHMEHLIRTKTSFLEGGDSGSIVYKKNTMEPVGLAFAGSSLISLIIPAETISKEFGVDFGNASFEEDESDSDEGEGGEDEVEAETPIWQMKEFWLPILTGIATAIALALELGTGIVVEVATIVSLGVLLLSIFLGVDWATVKKHSLKLKSLQAKVKGM